RAGNQLAPAELHRLHPGSRHDAEPASAGAAPGAPDGCDLRIRAQRPGGAGSGRRVDQRRRTKDESHVRRWSFREHIMHVGILTAPLRTRPLAELIPWAAQQGIRALEIDVRSGSSLEALKADDAALEQLQGLLSAHKLQISSLACYGLLTGVS